MNDELLTVIAKQLKIIKFWLTLFGSLIVITLLVLGFLLFRLITFTSDAVNSVQSFQEDTRQSLDLKQRLCADDASGALARAQASVCD